MVGERGLFPVIAYFLVQQFGFISNINECSLGFKEKRETGINSCTSLVAHCAGSVPLGLKISSGQARLTRHATFAVLNFT